jgi:hypothetical protein
MNFIGGLPILRSIMFVTGLAGRDDASAVDRVLVGTVEDGGKDVPDCDSKCAVRLPRAFKVDLSPVLY